MQTLTWVVVLGGRWPAIGRGSLWAQGLEPGWAGQRRVGVVRELLVAIELGMRPRLLRRARRSGGSISSSWASSKSGRRRRVSDGTIRGSSRKVGSMARDTPTSGKDAGCSALLGSGYSCTFHFDGLDFKIKTCQPC